MLEMGGALLFPSEPVKMKYDAFQKEFGEQPFRVGKVIQFVYHAGWIVAKNTQWKRELDLILERLVTKKGLIALG